MKRGILLLISPVLVACTSIPIQDMRREAPARSAIVMANYADLGGCVAEGLQTGPRGTWMIETGDLVYEFIHRQSQNRFAVTGRTPGEHAIPLIDILFLGEPDGRTRVESRWGGLSGSSRSGGQRIDERVWPIIERCAGVPLTPMGFQPAPIQPTASPVVSNPSSNMPATQVTPISPQSQPLTPQAVESPTTRRLRELNDLRKQGLITDSEYNEKRKAILSEM